MSFLLKKDDFESLLLNTNNQQQQQQSKLAPPATINMTSVLTTPNPVESGAAKAAAATLPETNNSDFMDSDEGELLGIVLKTIEEREEEDTAGARGGDEDKEQAQNGCGEDGAKCVATSNNINGLPDEFDSSEAAASCSGRTEGGADWQEAAVPSPQVKTNQV